MGFNFANKPQSRLKPTKHKAHKNRIRKPFIKNYKIPLKVKIPFGKDEVTGSNPVISSTENDHSRQAVVIFVLEHNGIRKGVKFIVRPVMTTKENMESVPQKTRIIKSIIGGVLIGFICGFVGASSENGAPAFFSVEFGVWSLEFWVASLLIYNGACCLEGVVFLYKYSLNGKI